MDVICPTCGANVDATTLRQCTGTNRQDGPCRRAPIRGGTVCSQHGGKAPQTIQRAAEALTLGREPAIGVFLDILERGQELGNQCVHCGRRDDIALVLRAAQIVLDRTGLGPTANLNVNSKRDKPDPAAAWPTEMSTEQVDTVAAVLAVARVVRHLTAHEAATIREISIAVKARAIVAGMPLRPPSGWTGKDERPQRRLPEATESEPE